ncbi:MAG: alkaline phosphatase family protein [Myxococcota bacterium]|nr:alkaline phosphatase family protein [Myxococcota bacterium]
MKRFVLPLAFALAACAPFADAPDGGRRVLLIGVDGAAWEVIGPMLERGELPTFARLVREGAYTTTFEVVAHSSPIAWTSMATSRAPEDHGITEFFTELPNGTKVPASSASRRARALWEIATRHGVSVGVVGWWATWPAEEIDGWLVTDHANPALADFLVAEGKYYTADREAMVDYRRDYFPPEIGPIVAESWVDRESFDYRILQDRAGLSPEQLELVETARWNRRKDYYSLFKTFFNVDYPLFRSARTLIQERPTDIAMVYFRGPDPVQHHAWDLVEPELFERPNPNLERDRGVVEGIYRYVDGFIAELMAASGPDTWTLVASDHGCEANVDSDWGEKAWPGTHSLAAKGVLFVHGPGVREGHRLPEASPYDVMPTILWLTGLPISEELEGRPLEQAFDDDFAASRTKRRVASYGPRETALPSPSSMDEAMLESLRALGYID